MTTQNFIILGNGLNKKLCPAGFYSFDMPGHQLSNWDASMYSMDKIIEYYVNKIPKGSLLWGHSLGGHVAINVALNREDLTVVNFGMTPLETLSDIGQIMTPVPEFAGFQSPDRTEESMKGFLNYSALGDKDKLAKLLECALEQDPTFNSTFFTTGIENYTWKEVSKARELGDRFFLVISRNEKIYNYEAMAQLPLNMIQIDYNGHTPWLHDPSWFHKVGTEISQQTHADANSQL